MVTIVLRFQNQKTGFDTKPQAYKAYSRTIRFLSNLGSVTYMEFCLLIVLYINI